MLTLFIFCPFCLWYLVFVPVCYAYFAKKSLKFKRPDLFLDSGLIEAKFAKQNKNSIGIHNRILVRIRIRANFARICQVGVNFSDFRANSHSHSKVPLRAVHKGYIAAHSGLLRVVAAYCCFLWLLVASCSLLRLIAA